MGLINEYFSKGFGCCLFSFLCTPSRAEMRVMPRSELPSMLFHHCPASLADSSLTHGNTLITAFGWQAGILLFLQKLICPVDSASRIRISEYSPNDHTSNSENISSSSQLLRSKSTVSAYFSGVGIYVPKMPFRIGRLWRPEDERAGTVLSPCQERHCGAAVCFCSPLDYLLLCRGMGNGFSYRGFSPRVCQKFPK